MRTPKFSVYQVCKKKSEELTNEELQAICRQFQETGAVSIRHRESEEVDKAGVDYRIQCVDGTTIAIDLKCRQQDYGDVLLELRSNIENGTPGWAVKEGLLTDFFVIYWKDSQRVIKLPAKALRMALKANLPQWCATYGTRRNSTACSWTGTGRYHSEYICIPQQVLLEAVAQFTPDDSPQAAK